MVLWSGLLAFLSSASLAAVLPDEHHLEKRDNCGAGIGSCSNGMCCSKWNYCGTTEEYCGDGCQPAYGLCKTPPAYDHP